MTRTEALRKVYKKVTNEEAPVTANTITEVLVALADKYSGDEPVTANTITDALVALADNYSGGGGGGSSDFSTAEVTFVNNSESYFECPMAVINDGEMYFSAISEAATYTTPLYNGSVILPSFEPSNVSGNAEVKGSGLSAYVEITGDCTITIS